jgi:hypothetical protein
MASPWARPTKIPGSHGDAAEIEPAGEQRAVGDPYHADQDGHEFVEHGVELELCVN